MKKVLLVNTNGVRAPYPAPPIGVCLAAAALGGRYEVRVYDGLADEGKGLLGAVTDFGPDYVGLGIRNIDDVAMDGGHFFVDTIRDDFARPLRRMTQAPMILGGSGFTIFPHELLEVLDADYGVVGEAEGTFPALLRALDGGTDPSSIPGVVCRGRAGAAASRCAMADVLNLPFSEIDLRMDYGPYRGRGSYPIQTKRGCAHRCVYCSYPAIEGRGFRKRRPEHVVDEIEEARGRLGDVGFEFVDSTFNDPAGHAEAVCLEMIRRGLKVRLRTMGMNPAGVTSGLLDLMKAAGFAQIDCTPDSASPTMLGNLRKNFTLEDLRQAAGLIRDHGMPTMWFFLVGGPGESEGTLRETFDFIDRFVAEEDMVLITEGLRIYPGTELHEVAMREGAIGKDEPLLRPKFYVSPMLGREGLCEQIADLTATRPNCVRGSESSPPPEMLKAAMMMREAEGLTEPMFRTLLRLRREGR